MSWLLLRLVISMHGLNMKNLNHCAPPRSPLYDQVQAENKDYDEVVAEVISKAVAFLMRTMRLTLWTASFVPLLCSGSVGPFRFHFLRAHSSTNDSRKICAEHIRTFSSPELTIYCARTQFLSYRENNLSLL